MGFFNRSEQYLQPRDHTDHTDINGRACIRAMAVKEFDPLDDLPSELYDDCYVEFAHNLAGDGREADAWSFASPVRITEKSEGGVDKEGLLPTKNLSLDDDPGYKVIKEASAPELFPVTVAAPAIATAAALPGIKDYDKDSREYRSVGAALPKGSAGILLAGSEERSQHNLLHPSWQGVIVADHRGKDDGRLSTRVVDVSKTDGAVDPDKIAGLDSAFKVIRSWQKNAGIAEWKGIDLKKPDIGRGLLETDGLFGFADTPRLCYGSESGGGVHSAGAGFADRHLAGATDEGHPICSGHINANTPIFLDATRDAPLGFDLRVYEKAGFAGQPQEVHIRYDPASQHIGIGKDALPVFHQGLFRLETFTPIYIPPPPPEDLKPRFPSEPLGTGGGLPPFDPSQPPDPSELSPDGSPLFGSKSIVISRGPAIPEGRKLLPGLKSLPLEDIDNKRNIRTRAMIYNELGLPSLSFRAICHGDEVKDLRYRSKPSAEDVERYFSRSPEIMRIESWAARRGCDFVYDNVPGSSRDAGGDVSGGIVFVPSQKSLDDQFTSETTSTCYVTLYEDDVSLAFGTPKKETGGVKDGFSVKLDTTNDRLDIYHHDSTGAATLAREYDAQGRDRKLCIATYGDGDDGDVTVTVGENYTAVKRLENLTINAAKIVSATNLPLFVQDTLTIGAGGHIRAVGDGGGGGDEGGFAGTGQSERWYGASPDGGEGGQSGGSGTAGTSAGPALGGDGGAGGAGTAGSAGAGGTATAPDYWPGWLEAILHGQDRDLSPYKGGASGGGGGAASGVDAGGGGAGGGVLVIVARHLILDTSGGALFRAIGGTGGAAINSGSGGGAGGGGGFVCLIYQTAEDHNGDQLTESDLLELIDVSGGSGGAGQGSGSNGSDGSDGNKVVFCHG